MKIAPITLLLIFGCAAPEIRYVTEPPKTVSIPDVRQPVGLTVTDETPALAEERLKSAGTSEQEILRMIDASPDRFVRAAVVELFTKNGIRTVPENGASSIRIAVEIFDVRNDGSNWDAKVRLRVFTPDKSKNVESNYKIPSILGASDAAKALSHALSMALNEVEWVEFME